MLGNFTPATIGFVLRLDNFWEWVYQKLRLTKGEDDATVEGLQ